MADDVPSDVAISKHAFLDLRNLALDCRELLQDLSTTRHGAKAREQMARFNILAANMNVYAEGVQALGFKLKDMPDISKLLKNLLEALQNDLEKQLLSLDEQTDASPSGNNYSSADTQSETSSTSSTETYRLLPSDENDSHVYPESKSWNSIQTTITSLSNLATLIYQSGNGHRKQRVERFMNLEANEMVYRLIEGYAQEKLVHNFPLASDALCERLAKSIANRRARFSYLNQHHQKISKLRQPAPQKHVKSNVATTSILRPDHHLAEEPILSVAVTPEHNTQPSLILSNTVNTKVDIIGVQDTRIGRAESVASVLAAFDKFPTEAKLDSTGTSFTCQYCYRKCPATESKGTPYQQHLIQDFEPFVCVFEGCTNAFSCAGSYSGWIAHMSDRHCKVEWHCWECEKVTSVSKCFSTSTELEQHLKDRHAETVSDSLRSTALEHSMLHDPQIFQECPFCGGLPIELEKQYSNQKDWKAYDALQKHVRNHLISVASILLPIDMGQPDDHLGDEEVKDDKSDAQSGDHSQLGSKEPFRDPILYCEEDSCDCKKQNSITDWSSLETTCQLITDNPKEILPKVHDDPIYSSDRNVELEWEFWWPLSLPPHCRLTRLLDYPGHAKDGRLLELFGIRPSSTTVQGRIVVAVDFGSTYSGLAWAHTDEPEKHYVVDTWPGSLNKHLNVPTTLLYDTENASQYRWGYQIYQTEPKYQCFKLGLCDNSIDLMKEYCKAFPVPPGNVTTIKLVTDYLTALREHMDTVLEERLSVELAARTPKEYILTVPGEWPHKVCNEILSCATAAGMGSRANIHLITETEAVAVNVFGELAEFQEPRLPMADIFVICHVGGGSVGLISYTVGGLTPTVTLREAEPSTHSSGGVVLTRIFAQYLKEKFASHPSWNDNMLFHATKELEQRILPSFNGDLDSQYSITVEDIVEEPSMGNAEIFVRLSGRDIQSVFDPFVGEIARLVRHHIDQTRATVKAVFLTGGFGAQPYFYRRLTETLPPGILIPESTSKSTASLEGALIARMAAILPVYRPVRVKARFARSNIGTKSYIRYEERLHERERRIRDPISLDDTVLVMRWLIRKGELITESEVGRINFYYTWRASRGASGCSMTLYSCDNDEAPLYKDDNVQEFANLIVDLNLLPKSEVDKEIRADGGIYYKMICQIQITLLSAEMVFALVFKDKKYDAITVNYR